MNYKEITALNDQDLGDELINLSPPLAVRDKVWQLLSATPSEHSGFIFLRYEDENGALGCRQVPREKIESIVYEIQ